MAKGKLAVSLAIEERYLAWNRIARGNLAIRAISVFRVKFDVVFIRQSVNFFSILLIEIIIFPHNLHLVTCMCSSTSYLDLRLFLALVAL